MHGHDDDIYLCSSIAETFYSINLILQTLLFDLYLRSYIDWFYILLVFPTNYILYKIIKLTFNAIAVGVSKYMEVWKHGIFHDGSAVTRGADDYWMTAPNLSGDHKAAGTHTTHCISMGSCKKDATPFLTRLSCTNPSIYHSMITRYRCEAGVHTPPPRWPRR